MQYIAGRSELELAMMYGREFVLSEKLSQVSGQFDFCLLSTVRRRWDLLTLNALVASN